MENFKLSFNEYGTKTVSFVYVAKSLDSAYNRAIKHLKQTNDNECLINPNNSEYTFRVRKSNEIHTDKNLNGFSFDGEKNIK